MQFGFAYHAIDLILGETARGRNGNLLFTPGRLVACHDIKNAIGVDVEGYLDLR